ncbi:MAG: phosphate acyltransferase PlsX [Rickettsiales bacterium]
MPFSLPIAIDAMGGDKAPEAIIQGARRVLKEFPSARFIFFGREPVIAPLIERHRPLAKASRVVHAETVIAMDEKPSVALRQGRESSMRAAINAVAEGKACAMVSAGNTGALMAMAKIVLRTLPGIHRPAITATVPSRHRPVVLLDMGANLECTAEYLVQFAVMGDAYARAVLGMAAPRIGLLNVGSEEMKGHDEVKEAHQMLRSGKYPIEYHGFVEGNDILEGTTDVVVTDGFTGNIALKTAEGASRLIYGALKSAFERSTMAKFGYLLARPALRLALKKFDPRKLNGAILLGLNGIVVKSHGGADGKSFANAIKVAISMVDNHVNEKILAELSRVKADNSSVVVPLTADIADI